jgi:hypothetical protein
MTKAIDTAAMIAAIRADALIGRGTCSTLDECWEDSEIAEYLTESHYVAGKDGLQPPPRTLVQAVRLMRLHERFTVEMSLEHPFDTSEAEVASVKARCAALSKRPTVAGIALALKLHSARATFAPEADSAAEVRALIEDEAASEGDPIQRDLFGNRPHQFSPRSRS